MTPRLASRIEGCLLGGAVGDALGAPYEFASWEQIRRAVGEEGITTVLAPGHFTDDTQMTLFTCQALLHANLELEALGTCDPVRRLYDAYLAWLVTQDTSGTEIRRPKGSPSPAGWLVGEPILHRREAPGLTCLSALESGRCGTITSPINDSKGCGGVMRAAPAGILTIAASPGTAPGEAYHLGCEVAAITHGHPDGIHAAGCLAAMIHVILNGASVIEAVEICRSLTTPSLRSVLEHALEVGSDGPPEPECLEVELGAGWVGEEALAIAVACAARPPSFTAGVLASVNHSGDTDSTGAICGNLLGAALGVTDIPVAMLDAVDGIAIVEQVATDVVCWVTERPSALEPNEAFGDLFNRYVIEVVDPRPSTGSIGEDRSGR
jgi:ADP-ribosylglycohydrolase